MVNPSVVMANPSDLGFRDPNFRAQLGGVALPGRASCLLFRLLLKKVTIVGMVHPVDPDATKHTYTRYKCMHKLHQITIFTYIYMYLHLLYLLLIDIIHHCDSFAIDMCMCACVLWV